MCTTRENRNRSPGTGSIINSFFRDNKRRIRPELNKPGTEVLLPGYYPDIPSSLNGTLSRFRILLEKLSATTPALPQNRFPYQRLFPRELPLPLLHFHQHDTDRSPFSSFTWVVPVKDNKIDRVAGETGISRSKKDSGNGGPPAGDPTLLRGTREVDGILPDIVYAFELPASGIVSGPPFDSADLPGEEVDY